MISTTLSRRYTGERRYKQKDLDRIHELAVLVIATVSPFQRLRRLTATESALLDAAHIIRCSVRLDGAGEFHLRGTAQMTLEEISNGHH